MADIMDRASRSRMMSAIRSKNTKPERLVRSALHRAGMRFALHDASLPGKPDIVLPARRAVVLVHGCFWHRHPNCPRAATPATNRRFWQAKFSANVKRDLAVRRRLKLLGWKVFVVWECQTSERRLATLARRIRSNAL
jgi:DNA mismatch endonuclease (patch repair protein)